MTSHFGHAAAAGIVFGSPPTHVHVPVGQSHSIEKFSSPHAQPCVPEQLPSDDTKPEPMPSLQFGFPEASGRVVTSLVAESFFVPASTSPVPPSPSSRRPPHATHTHAMKKIFFKTASPRAPSPCTARS